MTGGRDASAGGGQSRSDAGIGSNRLVVYGTLIPGGPNHGQLERLNGRWLSGQLRGRLVEAGWGASHGFPGLVLDPDAEMIDVHVFESADLPAHWARLDEFEGPQYRRVVTKVSVPDGEVDALVYEIRAPDEQV